MSLADLKQALRAVEALGLAPLARVYNTRPKSYYGSQQAYAKWTVRLRETEALAITQLSARGASVSEAMGATRFRMAGVSASSTMGLEAALRNWKTGAEKRLKGKGNSR